MKCSLLYSDASGCVFLYHKQTKISRPTQHFNVISYIATCFDSYKPSSGISLKKTFKKSEVHLSMQFEQLHIFLTLWSTVYAVCRTWLLFEAICLILWKPSPRGQSVHLGFEPRLGLWLRLYFNISFLPRCKCRFFSTQTKRIALTVALIQVTLMWKSVKNSVLLECWIYVVLVGASPLYFNPLNPELNPICYLLALLGAHHFLHASRIRVKSLTFRQLMSYIYGAPILDVSRSHTTTQRSR